MNPSSQPRSLWFFIFLLGVGMHPRVFSQTFRTPPAYGHFGIAPFLQRSFHQLVDLDGDGRIDLRCVQEDNVNGPPGRRVFLDAAPGVSLVGSGFKTFRISNSALTGAETTNAVVGLVVDPSAPPAPDPKAIRSNWLRISDNVTGDGGDPGRGAATPTFYIGVLFTAVDGVHAGWVHFVKTPATGKWQVTESAWNPVPGASLQVGTAPMSRPVLEVRSEYIPAPPPLGLADRDITLGRRWWTNHSDLSHGLIIDVRGQDEWRWWTQSKADTNVALNVPERLSLPELPPNPLGAWTAVRSGAILYSESYDAAGPSRTNGPLASAAATYSVFRTGSYQGWVRVAAGGGEFTVARVATAVGGHEETLTITWTASASNVDLNHDGWVDFILHTESFSYFDDHEQVYELESLSGSGILGAPDFLPTTPVIPVGPTDHFVATNVIYYRTFINGLHEITHGGWLEPAGMVGLRFQAADGSHYGWARFERAGVPALPNVSRRFLIR